MAQVPDTAGLSTVSPDATPPDDYQRISTNPGQFGAAIGQGLDRLGAGASHTAKVFGEIQTDDAINGAMDQVNKTLDHFRSLSGRDALDAQESTRAAIDAAFKNGRTGLFSADQQHTYDQTTRMYQQRYVAGIIASHADQQSKLYATDVNNKAFTQALTNVANVADDPDHVEAFRQDARRAQVRQLQVQGNASDPDALAGALAKADQAVFKTQIETVAVKDPLRAAQLADEHKAELGVAYAPLASALRARVNNQEGQAIAGQAIGDVGRDLSQPGGHDAANVKHALLEQESGNSAQAPATLAKVGPDGKPIFATGPGQILPDTFARFAKPGEDINNADDNRAVSARYVDHLAQLTGNDPARIAVGYFSGEGNISPAGSPLPFLVDKADRTGKTVSSYVADVQARMTGLSPGVSIKGSVYQRVLDATRDKPPEVRQAALREVNEQYTAAQVASAADLKARKDASDQAANGYVSRMMKGDMGGIIGEIANDPSLDHQTKASLWNMAESHAKRDAGHDIATYGPGFYDLYSKIHLPEGDPERIVDPRQLFGHVGEDGDLTVAGVDRLSQEMAGRKTADGEAESAMRRQFLANAKKQISGADPLLHIADPKGEELYLKFMAGFFPAYDAAKAAGKSPAALLNPESPDYLGKSIASFKRPLAEFTADILRGDSTEPTTEGAAASSSDTSTQAGLIAAVRAGRITREEGERVALGRGWISGSSAPAAPAPPIR